MTEQLLVYNSYLSLYFVCLLVLIQETCFMYWNSLRPVCFGEFEIEMKNMFQEKGFVQRQFVIRNIKVKQYNNNSI